MSPEEKYYLRRFNPALRRDLETVELMESHSALADMPDSVDDTGEELAYKDFLSFDISLPTDRRFRNLNALFAVVNKASHVVGLIWYYTKSAYTFPLKEKRRLKLTGKNILFIQVSYYKLMHSGWDQKTLKQFKSVPVNFVRQKRKGVIVSGLKQSLDYLARQESGNKVPRKILVYAYTHPTNLASEHVLRANGFTLCDTQYIYDEDPSNLWYKRL